MAVKAILILCAQALLIQAVYSASHLNYGGCGWNAPALPAPIGLPCGAGLGYGSGLGYGAGLGCSGIAIEAIPTSGGGLPVSSISPIAPSGLSISSENAYEGALSAAGELPFVSAVALEGVVPSAGAGAVSYSCGNGVTAIESIAPSAAIAPGAGAFGAAYGSGIAGLGAGAPGLSAGAPGLGYGGLVGRGCGCGLY